MRLRLVTAGESHGPALVTVLEGLPHGLLVDLPRLNDMLRRRQGGYGRGGRQKIEKDTIEILGGIRHGRTLGSPVALLLRNRDFENWADEMSVESPPEGWEAKRPVNAPRPGHADLAGALKLNAGDPRDVLERASARETAARVAGGALCLQLLHACGIEVLSHVRAIGGEGLDPEATISSDEVATVDPQSNFRCVDDEVSRRMQAAVDAAREAGDTLGGVFEVIARDVPPGLGSHVHWDRKLDGRLMQAVGSIQGVKAAEVGEGIAIAARPGSRVHDEIVQEGGGFRRPTNRSGGLEGGITHGGEVRVRGYMKPLSTLRNPLRSVNLDTGEEDHALVERSDVCSVPAAAVVGEAMVCYVLADALLEKFGGDSMTELLRNLESYREQVESLFPRGS